MIKIKNLLILALLSTTLIFSGCKKDENETGTVEVYLHDAPAVGYDKIKVEVKGISIYSVSSGEWVSLTVNNGIYDLLTLDGSHPAFLGKMKVNGGNISQVQVVIGNQNNVSVSGISYPLVLDSTDLDKLKVKIDQNISPGSNYKLTIDFKANESVDANGNLYKLKASLKVTVKEV